MKYTGIVLDWRKSYGFIRPDKPEMNDIFVHYSGVEPRREGFKELQKGQSVRFEIREGQKGPEAYDVEIHEDDRKSLFGREMNNEQK